VAISPPSDIVLDVASAADPAKVRLATERLAKLAADPTATANFADTLASTKSAARPSVSFNTPALTSGLGNARNAISRPEVDKAQVYQKFEAVLLQNFVSSILPKDTELFGDKNSADIYRSMMAEQLANQLAKSGRLGIAKQIMGAHPPGQSHAQPVKTDEV
jgi:peptidoglycan hydrolase FlgJ